MTDMSNGNEREVPISPSEPANETSLTIAQRLKAALWFAVGKIVDEESIKQNCNATPQYIGALTEMVWAQIGELEPWCVLPVFHADNPSESVATDLESFSRHARRSTVHTEDVVLLARKNPDLLDIVRGFVEEQKAEKLRKGKGKQKR
ncbi:hypothetical protein Landi51_02508 [Colletotrichum acutatum]